MTPNKLGKCSIIIKKTGYGKFSGVINEDYHNPIGLFVLRITNMPAALVEVGFITNTEEAKRCADSNSQ